jgi:hypothetical protein
VPIDCLFTDLDGVGFGDVTKGTGASDSQVSFDDAVEKLKIRRISFTYGQDI